MTGPAAKPHDRNTGLAATVRALHAAGRADRDRRFVHDRVHLSRLGHDLVAETVQGTIETTAP